MPNKKTETIYAHPNQLFGTANCKICTRSVCISRIANYAVDYIFLRWSNFSRGLRALICICFNMYLFHMYLFQSSHILSASKSTIWLRGTLRLIKLIVISWAYSTFFAVVVVAAVSKIEGYIKITKCARTRRIRVVYNENNEFFCSHFWQPLFVSSLPCKWLLILATWANV